MLPHHQTDEIKLLPPSNPAPTYVALSIATFLLSKFLLRKLAPLGAKCQGPVTVWKWVNTANSLVHSVVTGIGAVVCIYLHPRVTKNVISTYSDFSHRLVSYSVGYFIFDIGDMLASHRKRSSYELILHHIFVLSCFTLSITTRYYLAFTIISLVVEVNSIFLHYRQLLLLTSPQPPRTSPHFKTISLLNITTFILFRITTLAWMTAWMATNSSLVNPAPYTLGIISITGLMLMSVVLLVRLVRADVGAWRRRKVKEEADDDDGCSNFNNNNDGHVGVKRRVKNGGLLLGS